MKKQHSKEKGYFHFLLKWIRNPSLIGSVAPSSKALSRKMARQVNPSVPGLIIELGPGTGTVTDALIECGIDENRLVLIEADEEFAALLLLRFPKAQIIIGDAYEIAALTKNLPVPVSAIVSSLPLFTQPLARRKVLLQEALLLLQNKEKNEAQGAFIQFTYALKSPISPDKDRFSLHGTRRVWWNMFPARVWIYRPVNNP
ncbi:MAG: rRNA adenine N-6-methyltransferase family protein [Alphaproteobacteria bacterium]|nr:rRNA adenine N-6-methyltransferase family protein [Alphaproteobacteria bacterium]